MPNLALFDENPVEAIVGREPAWIVRSGILLIFSICIALLFMSWLIRYPDTINARVVLTTVHPPAELVAKVDARIVELFIEDGEAVEANTPLLLLESNVDYPSLVELEKRLNQLRSDLFSGSVGRLTGVRESKMAFGELQFSLNNLVNSLDQFHLFNESKSLSNRISSSEVLLERYEVLHQQLLNKRSSQQRKVEIERNNFVKNKDLIEQGVLAESELAPLENRFLDRKLSLDDLDIQLELNNVKLEEIRSGLTEYKIQHQEQRQKLLSKINQDLLAFDSELAAWKKRYLIVAPVAGSVSFSHIWSSNQQVKRGDVVMVVFNDNSQMIGKVSVSHMGAGKIRPNQRVNIELDSYPAIEFGKVMGTVSTISTVPDKDGYKVDIQLPYALVTSYDKTLSFTPKMVGSASIITQERRLIERFFDKIIYTIEEP